MAAATKAMRRMPPTMTKPSRVASAKPDSQVGTPNDASRPVAMLLLCGRLPVPKALNTVATAKNTASHFRFRPRSMKYMGPPAIFPCSSVTR